MFLKEGQQQHQDLYIRPPLLLRRGVSKADSINPSGLLLKYLDTIRRIHRTLSKRECVPLRNLEALERNGRQQ